MATSRQSRSWYSKVGLHAPLSEVSGTSVAGQRRKLRYGAKTGFINGRLPDDFPLDAASAFWCNRLYNQVLTYGTNVNIGSYTFPVYEADHDTPYIHLADLPDGDFMNNDLSPYAWGSGSNIPWEGPQQGGTNPEDRGWRSNDAEVSQVARDRSILIIDPNRDMLVEAWQVTRKDEWTRDNWLASGNPPPAPNANPPHDWPNVQAQHGGRMPNLSRFSGAWPNPYGLTGTGISAGVGMILFSEVQQGVIPHAIKFAVAVGTATHRRPANRGDQAGGTNDFPEGSRVRLPYDFDVTAYCTATGNVQTPFARMVMTAARDYGMVCNDAATGVVGVAGVEDLRPAPFFLSDNNPWLDYMMGPLKSGVTGTASTGLFTLSNNELSAGDVMVFRSLTGGTGLTVSPTSVTQGYYRVLDTPTPGLTFRLTTEGGSTPVTFGTDVTAGTFERLQWGYQILHPNRFPWDQFQLLPESDG